MFGFRKKYKYTAYHDKNKDHNYTIDFHDDEESESFLVDDFNDIPSADNNDEYPPKDNWPKATRDRKQNGSHSASKSTTVSISADLKNTRKSSVDYPDPEIDERRHQKNKKIAKLTKKEKKQPQYQHPIQTKKKKTNFMSKMMNAIKQKTNKIGKKKGKYDQGNTGERPLTPLTTSDDDEPSDYYDDDE